MACLYEIGNALDRQFLILILLALMSLVIPALILWKKRSASEEPIPPRQAQMEAYRQRMQALGYPRMAVLGCMLPVFPAEDGLYQFDFDPPALAGLDDAFYHYLQASFDRFAQEDLPDRPHRSPTLIPAAGLATYGRLDMVEHVLDRLPEAPLATDHFAGKCWLLPYICVNVVLPLPQKLADLADWHRVRWVKGTPEGDALIHWFHRHRDRLQWDGQGRFILPEE